MSEISSLLFRRQSILRRKQEVNKAATWDKTVVYDSPSGAFTTRISVDRHSGLYLLGDVKIHVAIFTQYLTWKVLDHLPYVNIFFTVINKKSHHGKKLLLNNSLAVLLFRARACPPWNSAPQTCHRTDLETVFHSSLFSLHALCNKTIVTFLVTSVILFRIYFSVFTFSFLLRFPSFLCISWETNESFLLLIGIAAIYGVLGFSNLVLHVALICSTTLIHSPSSISRFRTSPQFYFIINLCWFAFFSSPQCLQQQSFVLLTFLQPVIRHTDLLWISGHPFLFYHHLFISITIIIVTFSDIETRLYSISDGSSSAVSSAAYFTFPLHCHCRSRCIQVAHHTHENITINRSHIDSVINTLLQKRSFLPSHLSSFPDFSSITYMSGTSVAQVRFASKSSQNSSRPSSAKHTLTPTCTEYTTPSVYIPCHFPPLPLSSTNLKPYLAFCNSSPQTYDPFPAFPSNRFGRLVRTIVKIEFQSLTVTLITHTHC